MTSLFLVFIGQSSQRVGVSSSVAILCSMRVASHLYSEYVFVISQPDQHVRAQFLWIAPTACLGHTHCQPAPSA